MRLYGLIYSHSSRWKSSVFLIFSKALLYVRSEALSDIRQLKPEIVNALIRRIDVHSKDKETKSVKVDIYFTAVGLFSIPTEKEMQAAMEEIRQNPQQFKFSA